MAMPEAERKQYEAYLEDLRYQASMVISNAKLWHLKGKNQGRIEERRATEKKLAEAGMSERQILEILGPPPEEPSSGS